MRYTTFSKDETGGVALAFGLIAFPLFFAIGAAYDYSRGRIEKPPLLIGKMIHCPGLGSGGGHGGAAWVL